VVAEKRVYFGSIEAGNFQRLGGLLGGCGLKDRIFEVFDLSIAKDSRNTRLQFAAFKCDSPTLRKEGKAQGEVRDSGRLNSILGLVIFEYCDKGLVQLP
jgi:hypothetical protein